MISTLRKRHQTIVSNKKEDTLRGREKDGRRRGARSALIISVAAFFHHMLCDCFLYSEK